MFKNKYLASSCAPTLMAAMWLADGAQAFCGFYVGKADASLFNDASKVVMVRDGDRTTINMLNDYKGVLKEFALVVPVPEVLQKDQIFMLPIRLGMINARGPQDLVLWVLTRNGRVEATNYRTVKRPANVNIPAYNVLQHAVKLEPNACPAAAKYLEHVQHRKHQEAETPANLTGWDIGEIRVKSGLDAAGDFWRRLRQWFIGRL